MEFPSSCNENLTFEARQIDQKQNGMQDIEPFELRLFCVERSGFVRYFAPHNPAFVGSFHGGFTTTELPFLSYSISASISNVMR